MSDFPPERRAAASAEPAALEPGHIGHGELESGQANAQPRQGTCDCGLPACASGALPSWVRADAEREAGQ